MLNETAVGHERSLRAASRSGRLVESNRTGKHDAYLLLILGHRDRQVPTERQIHRRPLTEKSPTMLQFRLGPPPDSLSDEELASGEWRRVPYLPLWALQLLALPVGLLMAALVLMLWMLLTPRVDLRFAPGEQIALAFFVILLAGMLLEILLYPGMGLTNQSIFGFWPSRLTPYTVHTAKITKRRQVATLLMPFVVLAVLPLALATYLRYSSGWLVFYSCAAASMFGLNIFLALPYWRLPSKSLIACRGFNPYWRVSLLEPGKQDRLSQA